jgi:four helix bundle protein
VDKPYVERDEYLDLVGEPEKPYNLSERFFSFAVDVIRQVRILPDSKEYSVIVYQLVKAASSIGANYEEAQAAVSKADFANKIGICLKEAREAHYWLRIIIATLDKNGPWKPLEKEGGEIKKILGSIYSKVSKRR